MLTKGELIIHRGIVAHISKDNIDTDIIMPKQFLITTNTNNLGRHSFFQWRVDGTITKPFFLENLEFSKATILLVGKNFGCGSSREHAPWSLKQCGLRVLVGISFAEIFFLNCIKNGILPIVLGSCQMVGLLQSLKPNIRALLNVCLSTKRLLLQSYTSWLFQLAPLYRTALIRGSVGAGAVLNHLQSVLAYEKQQRTLFTQIPQAYKKLN
ncbi:3-isopropylmalate dehydratase small subunit [Candidatus Tremblaya phenacola PAVE]|nr:3-isopropylmalate dehydratase small subunit [Candidatus Tremblaya phenacola PAVE]